MTDNTANTSRHLAPWLDYLIVLLALLLAGLLGAVIVRNSDVWLHLATGRAIAHGEYHFGVDPFGFTTAGRTWVNHSWLFDLGLYGLYKTASDFGVVFVRCVVAVGIFLTFLRLRKPSSSLAIPAIGATLAILAANARLPYLQPVLVTYLFLAILIALLHRGDRRLPIWVGLLCVVWVNVDGWFILGPITVALWLIGSLIRRDSESANVRVLAVTLIAALVGGLINPHHIFAYACPDDLALMLFAPDAAQDSQFRSYFETGFASPQIAPATAYAFYTLLAIGLTSFTVNASAISVPRLVVWIAFALLATWRWRFIPFFAIAGTPLVVLNLQEALARWDTGRQGRMIGVAFRGLAVGGLALLIFAAWPGWLGPRTTAERMYRVGPRVIADPAIEKVAKQVNDWIGAGRLAKSEKIFSPSVDVAHHLAWFAPDAKSFMDSRWRLFIANLGEYVAARQAFTQSAKVNDIERFIGQHSITGIIIAGSDDGVGAARMLWAYPDRFAFRALAGRVTYFGCIAPGFADSHPDLRLDPVDVAFAPRPMPEWARPPYEEPRLPTFWDNYLRGTPATPAEFNEGTAWLEYVQVESQRQQNISNAWGATASVAYGSILASGASAVEPMFFVQSAVLGLSPGQLLGRPMMSDAVAAGPILAGRALRMAQAKIPSDPRVRLTIAEAFRYWAIRFGTAELQTNLVKLQRVSALRQAMSLLEQSHQDVDTARLIFFCADQLANYHFESRQFDLGLDAAKQALRVFPVLGATEQEFQERVKQVEQLEQQVRAIRNQYEIAAERDTPAMRFRRAIASGLPGEALAMAQTEKGSQGIDPFILLNLLLQVGRGEEARTLMHDQFPASALPAQLQSDYRWLQFHTASVSGDFPGAIAASADFIKDMKANQTRAALDSNVAVTAFAVAADPIGTPGLARVMVAPLWLESLVQARRAQGELHNMLIRQGLIALQAGDTRLAKQAIHEALEMRLAGAGFTSQDEAVLHKTAEFYDSLLRSAARDQ